MLEALKKKLSLASTDLSSGITRLKTRKSPSLPKFPGTGSTGSGLSGSATVLGLSSTLGPSAPPSAECRLQPYAGQDILHHYEAALADTRDLSEASVAAADRASAALQSLCSEAKSRSAGFLRLHRELGALPALLTDLRTLGEDIARLGDLCRSAEAGLAYIDVLADTGEVQGRCLDSRFSLAMLREEKVAAINEAKAELSASFCEQMEARERRRVAESAEKSALYEEAFNQDLSLYKSTGLIAKKVRNAETLADSVPSPDPLAPIVMSVKALPRVAPVEPISRLLGPGRLLCGLDETKGMMETGEMMGMVMGSLGPAQELDQLEAFLSDVRMEDSGIAGSDSQSVEGETEMA